MKYWRIRFYDEDGSHNHNNVEGLVAELTLESETHEEAVSRAKTLLGDQATKDCRYEEIHGYFNNGCKGSQSTSLFVP